jgi:hypothetical protein
MIKKNQNELNFEIYGIILINTSSYPYEHKNRLLTIYIAK